MAVGNVGETLAEYKDSDTFLSRDAGFTWEEVRKDAHMWEFGDSGSLIVMVNDEEPTDFLLYSTDEGANWREYQFSDHKVRVMSIVNVPSDTSRRFLLLATPAKGSGALAIHVDFSSLVTRQCRTFLRNILTESLRFPTQVPWIFKIPRMTTSSSGAPVRTATRSASSVDR